LSVSIVQPFAVDLDLSGTVGAVGPITVQGIPNDFSLGLTALPTIQLGTVPPITLEPLTIEPLTIQPLTINVGTIPPITLEPISLSVAITKIPSVRAHVPSNYCVGFSLLGIELFSIRLCGETQIITEPFIPNPCEICSPLAVPRDVGIVAGK
jgi:hypothetical protein